VCGWFGICGLGFFRRASGAPVEGKEVGIEELGGDGDGCSLLRRSSCVLLPSCLVLAGAVRGVSAGLELISYDTRRFLLEKSGRVRIREGGSSHPSTIDKTVGRKKSEMMLQRERFNRGFCAHLGKTG